MFSLAHISDIHLSPLPSVRIRELISKRITGYANWHANRAKTHGNDTLNTLIADIKAHGPDHTAITGDLVNLALGAEFAATKRWLEEFGPSEQVSVVPGNHDAYVAGALLKAHRAWGNYMPVSKTSLPSSKSVDAGFPYVRRVGQLAIIGVSSAVASAPFLATGIFRNDQAERLRIALLDAKKDGLFRVILIHHPPFRYDGDSAKRLYGIRLFQRIMTQAGGELVLHGHTHRPSRQQIAGGSSAIPIIGVTSASQSPGGHRPAARWNAFKISGEAGKWNCHWTERGVQADGTVAQLSARQIIENGKAINLAVLKD
jgi:3',5'-cyclic AMP phosphodiesterase CpdA